MKNERLEEIRKDLGLNKTQFADALNISPHSYYHILDGKSSLRLEHIENLMMNKGVNPIWIMTGEGEKFIAQKGDEVKTSTGNESVQSVSKTTLMTGVMRFAGVPAVKGDLSYDMLDNLVTKAINAQGDYLAKDQQSAIEILSLSWISMLELVQELLDQNIEFQYGAKKYRFHPEEEKKG